MHPLRILVADDYAMTAAALGAVFSLQGHHVSVATDGSEALARAMEHEPQILVLDIHMRGMTGWQVGAEARKTRWGRHSFILACTGLDSAHDIRRSAANGFDAHLVKPADARVFDALTRSAPNPVSSESWRAAARRGLVAYAETHPMADVHMFDTGWASQEHEGPDPV